MIGVLPWFYIDVYGQEQGPVPGSSLRAMLQHGRMPQGFLVRLLNWDRHFTVEELWPSPDAAFVLPPAWPDTCGISTSWQRARGSSEPGSVSHRQTPSPEQLVIPYASWIPPWPGSSPKPSPPAQPAALEPEKLDSERRRGRTSVSRAKDEINTEISAAVDISSLLDRSDFDPFVRQHLHALHGLGGVQLVRTALAQVQTVNADKTRDSTKNWSAYLVRFLKHQIDAAKLRRRMLGTPVGRRSVRAEDLDASPSEKHKDERRIRQVTFQSEEGEAPSPETPSDCKTDGAALLWD
eukprot:TRINITY_DN41180_c0_g1_i1.p1 TRINITY_DN41180_c0_g1~~TRINITY_DN41180_c0_g1_i1.p1  ORF type:complete len:294 (+),score=39.45 TRINITY_DN41180_c0_g1_i1:72-953(+)